MVSRQEAQAKFNEYPEAQGSHDEVYTDGSKMNERVGAAAVINRHFQNGETSKKVILGLLRSMGSMKAISHLTHILNFDWDHIECSTGRRPFGLGVVMGLGV